MWVFNIQIVKGDRHAIALSIQVLASISTLNAGIDGKWSLLLGQRFVFMGIADKTRDVAVYPWLALYADR